MKKAILKLTWNHKRPQRAKAILSKKNYSREFTIPALKMYYRVIVINEVLYWHKQTCRTTEQN